MTLIFWVGIYFFVGGGLLFVSVVALRDRSRRIKAARDRETNYRNLESSRRIMSDFMKIIR